MPFPGAKATLSDRGLGVTLILRGPEPFDGGRVIDALVSHIDIYPTVCEHLGIARPPFLQGVSLLPLLRGHTPSVREEIFAGSTWHAAYEPQRAIRTERHKYIRRWGERRTPVLANTDDGPSKDAAAGDRLGRAGDPQRTAVRPRVRPQRGEQPRG